MPLSREELDSLAHEHGATDLLADEATAKRMTTWTVEEVTAFFESAGIAVPDDARAVGARREGMPTLLCLHDRGGCGETLVTQDLAPLELSASYDLLFLNGDHAATPKLSYFAAEASAPSFAGATSALRLLARAIARASVRGARHEGVVAVGEGASVLILLLALVQAAEEGAGAAEAAAAALPAGEAKVLARKAAAASVEHAARRARVLRPPFAVLLCPSGSETGGGETGGGETGDGVASWWRPSRLAAAVAAAADDGALTATWLAALDDGLAQAEAAAAPPPAAGAAAAAADAPPAAATAAATASLPLAPLFGKPLRGLKALVVTGARPGAAVAAGAAESVAAVFARSAAQVLKHAGSALPTAADTSTRLRVTNFLKVGRL